MTDLATAPRRHGRPRGFSRLMHCAVCRASVTIDQRRVVTRLMLPQAADTLNAVHAWVQARTYEPGKDELCPRCAGRALAAALGDEVIAC